MAELNWLICANGAWPIESVWRPLVHQADVIMACDGALEQCLERGVQPHRVIGDMDSIDLEQCSALDNAIEWIEIKNQENSDLSKALHHAAQHASKSIDVIGIEGGELGHQIAAYFALLEAPENTTLHTGTSRIKCVKNESLVLDSIEIGSRVSLFAFEPSIGVTLKGCSWILDNEEFKPGTRGLNNQSVASTIQLDVNQGAVLICIETP